MFVKIFLSVLIISAGLVLSVWAVVGKVLPGELASETREVSGFSRIELHGAGRVILTQGTEESLVVEAGENLLPYIKTEVRGGTLHLSIRTPGLLVFAPGSQLTYRIGVIDLEGIGIGGSGSFEAVEIKTGSLDARISGSGRMSIEKLETDNLLVNISGSGTTQFAGTADSQTLSISGSGRLLHSSLESREASVRISGSGRAEVWAADDLDVTVSGSGTVIYQGTPALTQHVSGVANIQRK